MSDKIQLGKLAEAGAQRDAIHVAIAPCVAGYRLMPGERVFLQEGKMLPERMGGKAIGILDPFLSSAVEKGEVAYLLLFPNTITGMRHHWCHPSFSEKDVVKEKPAEEDNEVVWLASEGGLWMRRFAERVGMNPDELMEHLDESYEKIINGGDFDSYCLGVDTPYEEMGEMWRYYGRLRGVNVSDVKNEVPFRCAC